MRSLSILPILTFCILMSTGWQCTRQCRSEHTEDRLLREMVLEWNRLISILERSTPDYNALQGARMLAYTHIAAFEAGLAGRDRYVSLAERWPEAHFPQVPILANTDRPMALNAAFAESCRLFFAQNHDAVHYIDDLELRFDGILLQEKMAVDSHMVHYGRQLAQAMWAWAQTDAVAVQSLDASHWKSQDVLPASRSNCLSCWQPDDEAHFAPLFPIWGDCRTFFAQADTALLPPPLAYDETPGSSFYRQAMEVFTASQPMSAENRWIAEFWSDDVGGLTMSPAGRWMSIAGQATVEKCITGPEALVLHLRMALAMNDAVIAAWKLKYHHNLIRPVTYIRRVIDNTWRPYLDTPSFPGYPAAHATLAGAAAGVLEQQFGDDFAMTDNTHKGRKEFAGMPRQFSSFQEMARENALSRMLAGVHFRMDCEAGLKLGDHYAAQVVRVPLKNH